MSFRFFLSPTIFLLYSALALLTVGCGSTTPTAFNGTGSVAAKLVWHTNNGDPLEKIVSKAADGVITVRVIVSALGMTDIQRDFAAADSIGTFTGIPAGTGRIFKSQGLDSNGIVTYQGEISNITIRVGQVTDVGNLDMFAINAAPVANAGSAQSVVVGATVTLDGSASSDANGDLLTYNWAFTSKPSGSSATLSGTTTVKPTFSPDVAGSYVLNLGVNDGKVNSANAATVTIIAIANQGSATFTIQW